MPVKHREFQHVVPRHSENRRGRRMNSRVPIRLEWDDPKGRRCSADAHTRVVNPYGCMVVLEHGLKLEHRVCECYAVVKKEIKRLFAYKLPIQARVGHKQASVNALAAWAPRLKPKLKIRSPSW